MSAPEGTLSSVGGTARGGAINILGAVATALLTFGVTLAITRGLPKEFAGVFFTATSAFLVVGGVAQLGTNTGLVYFIARTRVLGRANLVPAYLRSASIPVLVWTTALVVVLWLTAPLIAGWISPDQVEMSAASIRMLAPFLWAASLENLAASATRGLGTMKAAALTTLVLRPVAQLVFVVFAVWFVGYEFAVIGWGLGYVVSAPVALWWSRRLLRSGIVGRAVTPVGREFWRFTAPRALMTVAQIAMQRLDIVLVGALAGAAPAAIYAAATRFVVAGQMGTQAVSIAAQPQFTEHLSSDDTKGASQLFRTSTAWLVLMTWPLYLVLLVHAGLVMSIFGDGYADGAIIIIILALALMFSTALGMVDVVLMMSGRSMWTLINSLIGLGLQIGIDIWLIPSHGVLGAAIGWAVAIIVRNVVALVQVMIALRIHPFGAATLLSCGLALIAGAVPLVLGRVVFGDGLGGLLSGGIVAMIAYGAGVVVLRRRLHVTEFVRSLRRRKTAQ
ncbi:lipopolysaccharide biosynthesis protein [Microbacterium sp. NPDC058345]|uniref:lipopolysaccharide biosynthesis protein n=1 Tax=Microbacterium sp. NPDC058345 TaxID=3346455 RepID=UPI003664B66B